MDLTPYVARGFPGQWDRHIAETPVAGLDLDQALSMVRLCPETAAALYGPDFSPQALRYAPGSRPELEALARSFAGFDPAATVLRIAAWVRSRVQHPHLVGFVAPDRGLSEEDLIQSGVGWCNEQSRVFVALCEVLEIPGRLCFLFHSNQRCGHTATEVFVEGKWAFVDVTFDVFVRLLDGPPATALELQGPHRDLAHQAYQRPLADYLARVRPEFDEVPGWGLRDRPTADRGGDLLEVIGLANYVIDGVEAI